MRIHTALAALLVVAAASFDVPASAQAASRAQLRLVVVDEGNAALPNAKVTIFTLDGNLGTTVTADEKGVAVFPDLPVGLAEIYATVPGFGPYIDKATLRGGSNAQTLTLESRAHESDSDTSGS
jgi:hypothetical protein